MPTPLTPDELSVLGTLPAGVDCRRVRLFRPGERGAAELLRRTVLTLSGGRAVALGNAVFLSERADGDLAVLAHELTHCGQYQRWGTAAYYARGAIEQGWHLWFRLTGAGRSPYDYALEPGRRFEEYGMEQQGQIVEDCFRGDVAARSVSPYRPG